MGRTSGNVVLSTSALLVLLWIVVAAMPYGWHRKSSHIWNFYVGLYHVEVDSKTVGGALAGWAARQTENPKVKALHVAFEKGSGDLQGYRDDFCNGDLFNKGSKMCLVWEHLYWGSLIEIFAIALTDVFLLAGSAFYMHYWHSGESREYARISAQTCFCLAPLTAFLGLMFYVVLSQNFCGFLVDLGLSHSGYTFSWSFFSAMVLVLFTCVPLFVVFAYAGKSELEDVHEALAQDRRDQAGMYGAQVMADPYAGVPQGQGAGGGPQGAYWPSSEQPVVGYPPQQGFAGNAYGAQNYQNSQRS